MVSAPPRPRPDFTGVARGQTWEEEGPTDDMEMPGESIA